MKLFNHRLYNQYYPVQTDEEAQAFIKEYGRRCLFRRLSIMLNDCHNSILRLYKTFVRKAKMEVNILGAVDEDAILYNRILKAELDCKEKIIHQDIALLEQAKDEILADGYMSIETTNHFLSRINAEQHFQLGWTGAMGASLLILMCVL